ncbi:MAG: hypothetical protein KDJ65_01710 [Anaerolineae bacterium]|nr:hypothetical protein [Anaerolineae bacterium]
MNEQANQPSSHEAQAQEEDPIPTDLPTLRGEIDTMIEFILFHYSHAIELTHRLKRYRKAELEAMNR